MRFAATLVCFSLAILAFAGPPDVTAESAIVVEANTGKVLWAKNATKRMFPASTTKILTALLLIENTDPREGIKAPRDTAEIGGSSLWMEPYELIRAGDMAYAIILRSANDGCHAVACALAGSEEAFSVQMNERARAIGCTGTNFNNPHGLHDPNHYSTAQDLSRIAVEALKNEKFREIAATTRKEIYRTIKVEDRVVVNRNRAIEEHGPTDGIKTGYTDAAGQCFVGSASLNGNQVVTVVLKSQDWAADHMALADWALERIQWKTLISKGETLGELAVNDGSVAKVGLRAAQDVLTATATQVPESWEVTLHVPDALDAPIVEGEQLGTALVTEEDGTVHEVALVSADSVESQPTLSEHVKSPLSLVLIAGMVGGAVLVRYRVKGWVR